MIKKKKKLAVDETRVALAQRDTAPLAQMVKHRMNKFHDLVLIPSLPRWSHSVTTALATYHCGTLQPNTPLFYFSTEVIYLASDWTSN